jgi:hypothetical protein
MSKPAVVSTGLLVGGVVLILLCGHNAAIVLPKVQAYAATGEPTAAASTWDWLSLVLTGLGGTGLSFGGIVAAVLTLLKQQAPAVIDRVAPGLSDGAKVKIVEVASITAIQGALAIVKDDASRTSLILAGRSAFDDLRDRTFPAPVDPAK